MSTCCYYKNKGGGGQPSVLNFEKGWLRKKINVLVFLKSPCHRYLLGGLTMFLVKKSLCKLKYGFEGSIFKCQSCSVLANKPI